MTLDHAAVIVLEGSTWYLPLRVVGRIAFVIFAFLAAQSIEKTSSLKRFCTRLAIFAVITEPIFDLAFYGTALYLHHQNIFFTLLAGVMAAWAYKRFEKSGAIAVCAIAAAAQLLNFDYGGAGIAFIFAFWIFGKENAIYVTTVFSAAMALDGGMPNLFSLAAVPLLNGYNGKRGGESHPFLRRWFFYIYYPLHIAIIGLLSLLQRQFLQW